MRYFLYLLLFLPALASTQSVPVDGETHAFESITEIEASHIYQVRVERGDRSTVRIEATDNIRNELRISMKGTRLSLGMDPSMNFSSGNQYRDAEVKVFVTLPTLRKLRISGAAAADIRDIDQREDITIELSGAGRINMDGQAPEANLEVSGAGSLNAGKFRVARCRARLAGASSVDVEVTDSLTGKVSGAASLKYSGSPAKQDVDVSGAGRVRGN